MLTFNYAATYDDLDETATRQSSMTVDSDQSADFILKSFGNFLKSVGLDSFLRNPIVQELNKNSYSQMKPLFVTLLWSLIMLHALGSSHIVRKIPFWAGKSGERSLSIEKLGFLTTNRCLKMPSLHTQVQCLPPPKVEYTCGTLVNHWVAGSIFIHFQQTVIHLSSWKRFPVSS